MCAPSDQHVFATLPPHSACCVCPVSFATCVGIHRMLVVDSWPHRPPCVVKVPEVRVLGRAHWGCYDDRGNARPQDGRAQPQERCHKWCWAGKYQFCHSGHNKHKIGSAHARGAHDRCVGASHGIRKGRARTVCNEHIVRSVASVLRASVTVRSHSAQVDLGSICRSTHETNRDPPCHGGSRLRDRHIGVASAARPD